MLNQHLRGTTAALNRLNLPKGSIAIDLERKAIRFYDGETLGGFEVVGTQAYEPPPLPGPKELLHGTEERGFYGEVGPEDFITYSEFCLLAGVSAGKSHYDNESLWLKFSHEGKVKYVPKKTLRYGLRYMYMVRAEEVVTLAGIDYQVRLLTGSSEPSPLNQVSVPLGGEWNDLMYPVHVDDPDGLSWGVDYTDIDIGIGQGINSPGTQTTCSEINEWHNPSRRITRGGSGITGVGSQSGSADSDRYGWRPVLEPLI